MNNKIMQNEILKNSFPVPDWFEKECNSQSKLLNRLLKKENVPGKLIKLIEKRHTLSDDDKHSVMEGLKIETRKNPKITPLLDMSNNYHSYLWDKLRYENWDLFGAEDNLKYDAITKKILVLLLR